MTVYELVKRIPFRVNDYLFDSLVDSNSKTCKVKAIRISTGVPFFAEIFPLTTDDNERLEKISENINILLGSMHPNVIKVYDCFKKGKFIFIIKEFCKKGSILNEIKDGLILSELDMLKLMKQLIKALDYIHCHEIPHQNIKPTKVLLSNIGIIKLDHAKFEHLFSDEVENNILFKAPEVQKEVNYNPFKSDIWSLGVTFYYIFCHVWKNSMKEREILDSIYKRCFQFPRDTPDSIIQIIMQMVVENPERRATTTRLLMNPHFTTMLSPVERALYKGNFVAGSITKNDFRLKRIPSCLPTPITPVLSNTTLNLKRYKSTLKKF